MHCTQWTLYIAYSSVSAHSALHTVQCVHYYAYLRLFNIQIHVIKYARMRLI